MGFPWRQRDEAKTAGRRLRADARRASACNRRTQDVAEPAGRLRRIEGSASATGRSVGLAACRVGDRGPVRRLRQPCTDRQVACRASAARAGRTAGAVSERAVCIRGNRKLANVWAQRWFAAVHAAIRQPRLPQVAETVARYDAKLADAASMPASALPSSTNCPTVLRSACCANAFPKPAPSAQNASSTNCVPRDACAPRATAAAPSGAGYCRPLRLRTGTDDAAFHRR